MNARPFAFGLVAGALVALLLGWAVFDGPSIGPLDEPPLAQGAS